MTDYPHEPGHVAGCDTSKAAADSMRSTAGSLRNRILEEIQLSGLTGRTCDELEVRHGRHQTVSARVRELVMQGAIKDSGRRRVTRSGRQARIYVWVPIDQLRRGWGGKNAADF